MAIHFIRLSLFWRQINALRAPAAHVPVCLGGMARALEKARAGDCLRIETPGGGAYGVLKD